MKLIIKAQTGVKTEKPWYLRLQEGFNNVTVGAAMAENPSVMTASGWRQAEDGKWKQDKVDDPGVQRLKSNLADLSMMSPTHPVTAAVDKTLPLVIKGSNYLWNQVGKRGNLGIANKAMSKVFNKSYTGNKPKTVNPEIMPEMVPSGVPSYIYNKDMDRLALATQSGFFTPQSEYQRIIGPYNFINKGEYYNPDWTNYYENIMKPLYLGSKNPTLPRTKPKLVVHGDNNRNWNGIFDYKTDLAYVTVNGNRSTGLHEWVSHGTDKYANSKDWSNLYLEHPEKFHSNIPSANWQELRATLNEARFNIYKELLEKLGKDNVSLDEFRSYIDNLGDRDIFNKTTRIDDSFPIKYINGYSLQYAKDMLSHGLDYFNRAVGRLRDALKNKYVQTGAIAIPLATKKGEPK